MLSSDLSWLPATAVKILVSPKAQEVCDRGQTLH